jgi:hypothetical protein
MLVRWRGRDKKPALTTCLGELTTDEAFGGRQFREAVRRLVAAHEEGIHAVTNYSRRRRTLAPPEKAEGAQEGAEINYRILLAAAEVLVIRDSDGQVASETVIILDNNYVGDDGVDCLLDPIVIAVHIY